MNKFDAIQTWLDNVAYSHSKTENTALSYRFGLQQFCGFVGKTAEEILKEYEDSNEKEVRRKYAKYLRDYIAQLSRKFTPNTIDARVGAIRSFFKYNDLPLAFVPAAKKHVVFHNRDIEKEEILKIIQSSRARDKAFYAMMAQGGLRPETLCNLRLKHIEPDFSKGVIPCKVDVPEDLAKGEYHSYITFIGQESVNYLKAYLNTRPNITKDSYLFTNQGTEDQANPKSFSRIFARTIQALKAKGAIDYEIRGNRKPSELRLYNLRKYFKKNSMQMGREESEYLMGHKQGVRDHYLPKDVEYYRKLYIEKAMPNLRLESSVALETDKQLTELREQLKKKDEDIEKLKTDHIKAIDEFRKDLDRIQQQVRENQQQGVKSIFEKRLESAKTSEDVETVLRQMREYTEQMHKINLENDRVIENMEPMTLSLVKALRQIPPEQLQSMTPEQLEKLRSQAVKELPKTPRKKKT